jgi:vacuolar protein sorting-associated protein 29
MANNYNNFGELVLIVGDLYISSRASKIPPSFQRMLVPQKMQHVICTGNASAADREHLATLAPNVHVVAGNYDVDSNLPETKVIQVGSFRIGVIHGHQIVPWSSPAAMAGMRRKLCVDILVSGHTHKNQVVTLDDGDFLYINPVSINRCSVVEYVVVWFTSRQIGSKK